MKLTQEQYMRYSRQLILPDVQDEGQEKLFKAKVLLVGMGGLGSPQALYLAAAGIGQLGLLDGDHVDLTNLQRQVIHFTTDLKSQKVISAQSKINALNPDCDVHPYHQYLDSRNAMDIISNYDIIVDCTDNFPARYLLNDACVLQKKPMVHGAVYRFKGQTTIFSPARGGPCYRCLYPAPPPAGSIPSSAEVGVMGMVPGIIGLIQAGEVIKLILGKGEPLIGRLLFCDLMTVRFQELAIQNDPVCTVCGKNPTIQSLADYEYNSKENSK